MISSLCDVEVQQRNARRQLHAFPRPVRYRHPLLIHSMEAITMQLTLTPKYDRLLVGIGTDDIVPGLVCWMKLELEVNSLYLHCPSLSSPQQGRVWVQHRLHQERSLLLKNLTEPPSSQTSVDIWTLLLSSTKQPPLVRSRNQMDLLEMALRPCSSKYQQ